MEILLENEDPKGVITAVTTQKQQYRWPAHTQTHFPYITLRAYL